MAFKRNKCFVLYFLVVLSVLIPTRLLPAEEQEIKLEKVAVSSLPEDIIAPNLGSVSIDAKGNVFAFAGKNGGSECFVVKFDENLKYLKRFGREGKGPGDFSVAVNGHENRLMIMANGDVYVIDHNPTRFVVFTNDGNYKVDIPFRRDYFDYFGHIYRFKASGNKLIVGVKYVKEKPYIGVLFSLEPPKILVNYQYSGEELTINGPGGYYQLGDRNFGHNPIIDTDGQHVVFGDSQVYKFYVYDSTGKLVLEVQDSKRRVRNFSDKEMNKIIDDQYTKKPENTADKNNYLDQVLANKPFYRSILAKIEKNKNVITDIQLAGDRIYVFPVSEDITVENHNPVEIYNLEGQVVRRGYLKEIPVEIWKNYAFYSIRDEEDNPVIVKYRILE